MTSIAAIKLQTLSPQLSFSSTATVTQKYRPQEPPVAYANFDQFIKALKASREIDTVIQIADYHVLHTNPSSRSLRAKQFLSALGENNKLVRGERQEGGYKELD